MTERHTPVCYIIFPLLLRLDEATWRYRWIYLCTGPSPTTLLLSQTGPKTTLLVELRVLQPTHACWPTDMYEKLELASQTVSIDRDPVEEVNIDKYKRDLQIQWIYRTSEHVLTLNSSPWQALEVFITNGNKVISHIDPKFSMRGHWCMSRWWYPYVTHLHMWNTFDFHIII